MKETKPFWQSATIINATSLVIVQIFKLLDFDVVESEIQTVILTLIELVNIVGIIYGRCTATKKLK